MKVDRQKLTYGYAVGIGILLCLPVAAQPVSPEGLWEIDGKATVQIYRCGEFFCGRLRGVMPDNLNAPRPYTDTRNPDPAMRHRSLCGLTILGGLRQAAGLDQWEDGWFYNPDDGKSYSVSAHLTSPDVLVARFYLGVQLLGESKTGHRLPKGVVKGSC
jgi:uncharacterized protein (DUF2147 family)